MFPDVVNWHTALPTETAEEGGGGLHAETFLHAMRQCSMGPASGRRQGPDWTAAGSNSTADHLPTYSSCFGLVPASVDIACTRMLAAMASES